MQKIFQNQKHISCGVINPLLQKPAHRLDISRQMRQKKQKLF